MKKIIAIIAFAMCFVSCLTTDDEARETLEKAGFTRIKTSDNAFFSCGSGDKFGLEFTATNPNGLRVSGIVCCGILKSCTVRF